MILDSETAASLSETYDGKQRKPTTTFSLAKIYGYPISTDNL